MDAEPGQDLLFVGMDLDPLTLWCAYGAGLFPMGVGDLIDPEEPYDDDLGDEEWDWPHDPAALDADSRETYLSRDDSPTTESCDADRERGDAPRADLGWFSPDPRGIVEDCEAHVSRSTRKLFPRFTITVNRAFDEVMAACGDESRGDQWITPDFISAYSALHDLGVAHSVEVWRGARLVGGLYGVQHGGLFAGESMFHSDSGASKIALIATALMVRSSSSHPLFDVQWRTEHLASQGVIDIPRDDYLQRVRRARSVPHGTLARFTQPYRLVWEHGKAALGAVDTAP